jgi:hypothetical protein
VVVLHVRLTHVAYRLDAAGAVTTPPEIRTVTTTYIDNIGETRTVTTSRNPGEGIQDWVSRHSDAVLAKMAEFPPATE